MRLQIAITRQTCLGIGLVLAAFMTLVVPNIGLSQVVVETVHGRAMSCLNLSELDASMKADDKSYFSGWDSLDFENEMFIVDHCPRPIFTGKRLHDRRAAFLNEMQAQIEQDGRAERAEIAREYAVQRQEQEAQVDAQWQRLQELHHNDTAGRLIRFYAPDGLLADGERHYVTGDTLPLAHVTTILFTDDPCPLPLADAENMRRAWENMGAYQVGCWYPTVDGNSVFVGQFASLTHADNVPLEAYPRGVLHEDKTITITEPDYDSRTFMNKVMNRRALDIANHLHEAP